MKKYSFEQIVEMLNEAFPEKVIDWEAIEMFAEKHDLEFCSGETRWCLFQNHWAEVIKIPRFDNVEDDYGAIELANYAKACDLGIERIFLPTRKIITLDSGCSVYAQTKFTIDHGNLDHRKSQRLNATIKNCVDKEICRKARHGMYQHHRINREWFARAYQIYGKRFMLILEDFTKTNRIGDLHNYNIGWLGKQPIILDFAGFHG